MANSSQSAYAPYLRATNWVSDDIYPVTGWGQARGLDLSEGGDWIGGVLNTFESWSGGKPQFQILETSNQHLSWIKDPRGVTAAEFRGTVWDSVIHGVQGLIYFPQSFGGGGFKYDATLRNVVAGMTAVDRQIRAWSAVLLSRGEMIKAPIPFEQAVRFYQCQTYVITLNMSHHTATLQGRSYAPYAARIQQTSGGVHYLPMTLK